MTIENCPDCGCTHIGSNECPFTHPPKATEWPKAKAGTQEPVAWRRTLSAIKKIALNVKPDGLRDGLASIVRLCIDAGSPPSSKRNWTEDASHENGNYECLCVECDQPFTGHKRRVICKACSELLSRAAPASQDATREALERCAKLADKEATNELLIFEKAADDTALSDSVRMAIQDRAIGRQSLAKKLAATIRALASPARADRAVTADDGAGS